MASKYAFYAEKLEDFYRYPEKYYVHPFRIYGNLWFVGNADVGAYLLDTEEGIVLIDTTYPATRAQMIQSVWEAGFRPADIRHILHTHGHFDHIGATAFLVSLSGARTYLGTEDAKMFRERPELMLAKDAGPAFVDTFVPDTELHDGDVLTFGSTKIRCVATPGHTMGVFTFFITLEEGGRKLTAALCGGVGLNTLCRDFIEQYHTESYREYFPQSMEKIKDERVDIVLGNHTGQNRTIEKYEKMRKDPLGPNPFVDPAEWKGFIEKVLSGYAGMLRDEEAGTDQI